jgi:hypothetical protein
MKFISYKKIIHDTPNTLVLPVDNVSVLFTPHSMIINDLNQVGGDFKIIAIGTKRNLSNRYQEFLKSGEVLFEVEKEKQQELIETLKEHWNNTIIIDKQR